MGRNLNSSLYFKLHLGQYDKAQVTAAINDYHRYTCLKFTPARNHRDRIVMQNGGGCSSYVGMTRGSQTVSLAPGCRKVRNFLHCLLSLINKLGETCRGGVRGGMMETLFENRI